MLRGASSLLKRIPKKLERECIHAKARGDAVWLCVGPREFHSGLVRSDSGAWTAAITVGGGEPLFAEYAARAAQVAGTWPGTPRLLAWARARAAETVGPTGAPGPRHVSEAQASPRSAGCYTGAHGVPAGEDQRWASVKGQLGARPGGSAPSPGHVLLPCQDALRGAVPELCGAPQAESTAIREGLKTASAAALAAEGWGKDRRLCFAFQQRLSSGAHARGPGEEQGWRGGCPLSWAVTCQPRFRRGLHSKAVKEEDSAGAENESAVLNDDVDSATGASAWSKDDVVAPESAARSSMAEDPLQSAGDGHAHWRTGSDPGTEDDALHEEEEYLCKPEVNSGKVGRVMATEDRLKLLSGIKGARQADLRLANRILERWWQPGHKLRAVLANVVALREILQASSHSITQIFYTNWKLFRVQMRRTILSKAHQFDAAGISRKALVRVCRSEPYIMSDSINITVLLRELRAFLTQEEASRLLSLGPVALFSMSPSHLKERVRELEDLGLVPLGRILSRNRCLLTAVPSPRVQLEQIHGTLEQVLYRTNAQLTATPGSEDLPWSFTLSLAKRQPGILRMHPATVEGVVMALVMLFGRRKAREAIGLQPILLTGQQSTIQRAVFWLVHKFGPDDGLNMALRHPTLMMLHTEQLEAKCDFILNAMGRTEKEIAAVPTVLAYSLARLKKRYEQCMEVGPTFAGDMPLSRVLIPSDDEFAVSRSRPLRRRGRQKG